MSEMIPMRVAWHLMEVTHKEMLCVLAGFTRIQSVDYMCAPWEYLQPEIKNRLLRVLSESCSTVEA